MRSLLLALAACASTAPAREPAPVSPAQFAADEAGFRKLLAGAQLKYGGLRFSDAACQTQFGAAAPIVPAAFDAFARCVAPLHLRVTKRKHWIPSALVLADDAGFEIEALFVDGRLDYIGFAGRAPGMPDLPTITPETLETLRTAGDPRATISAADAERVVGKGYPLPTYDEYLRVCLNETGQVIKVMPSHTTSPASLAAFAAVVGTWTFRPFAVAGAPLAVCAIVVLQYPSTPTGPEPKLPRPPDVSKAGNLVYNVSPLDSNPLKLAGDKVVVPDDIDKIKLNGKRISGSFKLCLDETGHYERGVMIRSTGVPRYDAKLARTLMQWTYRPFVVDGAPIPFCTAITFVYSQR